MHFVYPPKPCITIVGNNGYAIFFLEGEGGGGGVINKEHYGL